MNFSRGHVRMLLRLRLGPRVLVVMHWLLFTEMMLRQSAHHFVTSVVVVIVVIVVVIDAFVVVGIEVVVTTALVIGLTGSTFADGDDGAVVRRVVHLLLHFCANRRRLERRICVGAAILDAVDSRMGRRITATFYADADAAAVVSLRRDCKRRRRKRRRVGVTSIRVIRNRDEIRRSVAHPMVSQISTI